MVDQQMADLEKEKMMRELEVKELVSKHRQVCLHRSLFYSEIIPPPSPTRKNTFPPLAISIGGLGLFG
jgi:hypothetical protein